MQSIANYILHLYQSNRYSIVIIIEFLNTFYLPSLKYKCILQKSLNVTIVYYTKEIKTCLPYGHIAIIRVIDDKFQWSAELHNSRVNQFMHK